MVRPRKKWTPVGQTTKKLDIEIHPPKCYGSKEPFCKRELCGDWFDSCQMLIESLVNNETALFED